MDTLYTSPPREMQTTLQAVYGFFLERGTWPTFGHLDRPLRKNDKLDLARVLRDIPKDVLQPTWSGGAPPQVDTLLRLTLEGVALCPGTESDLYLFFRTLRWFAKKELDFEPSQGKYDACAVSSADLVRAFRLKKDRLADVQRLGKLLAVERWGSAGSKPAEQSWEFTLGRDVRRFAQVRSLADYRAVQATWRAESDSVPLRPLPMHARGFAQSKPVTPTADYVHPDVVAAIEAKMSATRFNCEKLLQLIAELNDNYAHEKTYSSHAILRAILDHVPPIFGFDDFKEAANNYGWGSRNDKNYMTRLVEFKTQAHDVLHRQISGKASLLRFVDMPASVAVNTLLQACADAL